MPGLLAMILPLLAVVADSQDLAGRIAANHYVYEPDGIGPFPALIAIPGCSGISSEDDEFENSNPQLQEDDRLFRRHYRKMATDLMRLGFVVYLVDVHRAEGVVTACSGEIPADSIAAYIGAAIEWVAGQPKVDSGRLHLIGWSMGGGGVLEWLQEPGNETEKLNAAIAVYPACGGVSSLTADIPLLMLLGGADDIADPDKCEALAVNAAVASAVTLRVYPGARHGYDIKDAPSKIEIGGGMTVGYQQAAAEASWSEIKRFLHHSD